MMVSAPDILNASILIVDDQEVNVSLLEQMLSEAGYTGVASTMNPQEVCALHRKHRRGHIAVLERSGLETRACECYAVVKKELSRLQSDVRHRQSVPADRENCYPPSSIRA